MIKLKSVIHDIKTNSVEATWVDRTPLPDIEVPATAAVLDDGGEVITPAVAAYTITDQFNETQVKCHSYADMQMDMLDADLGADASTYADLIATVKANIVPYVPPTLTSEQLQALIVTATQQRLDDFAQTRNYDGILSACTYAPSLIDRFRADGVYCVGARDQTWAALYAFMGEVEAGTKPMPTSFAEVEPLLPVLSWPV